MKRIFQCGKECRSRGWGPPGQRNWQEMDSPWDLELIPYSFSFPLTKYEMRSNSARSRGLGKIEDLITNVYIA